MTTEVETPDGVVEFPDGMSMEQIQTALLNHYQGGGMKNAPGYKPYFSAPGSSVRVDIGGTKPEEPAPAPPAPDRSGLLAGVDAFARGVTGGATGNFADELVSGLNTILPLDKLTNPNIKSVWDGTSFGDAFRANMAQESAVKEADADQNPMLQGVGNVAGAVGQAVLGGQAFGALAPEATAALKSYAASAPLRTAAATGAAGGALGGAIAGAGAGDTLASRGQGALSGGGLGAMLGGAISPVVVGLAPTIARYARTILGGGATPEALRQLTEKLAADGFDVTSPSGVLALRQHLSSFLGKPVSLADVGTATRSRVGVGLRAPSGAQQQSIDQVMNRSAGQASRLADDIHANVAPRSDVHALDADLAAQREQVALPLRDQALFESAPALPPPRRGSAIANPEPENAGMLRTLGQDVPETYSPTTVPTGEANELGRQSRIVNDPILQQLARLPDAQKALQAAVARAQSENALKTTLGQPIDHLPDISATSDLDVRTLDLLKRHLDDEVNRLFRRGDTETFTAGQANQVKDLRNAIRDRMREVVPHYGDYLDSYKGSSEMMDALEEGRAFDSLDPEAIAAGQGDRSKAAQELYRVGTARNLLDIIRSTKDGRNPASRILNSDESRAQLAATGVSPENAARLNTAVGLERDLNRLPAELAGSQTAQRTAAAADADASASGVVPFNPTNPVSWGAFVARLGLNKAGQAMNAGVNEALLPRALATDRAAIERTIKELEAAGQKRAAAALRKQLHTRQGARAVGTLIGGPLAVQEGNK